jgi:DeoR family myo-inositol catabolism operon transcriptional repressor
MLARERRNKIVNMVKSEGSVSIEDLLKEFDVSRITIWKDLKLLEDQGFLARVHGGAMRLDKLNPEEEEFPLRKETSSKEKKKIAQHAAKNYVKDDQILFLDGGTTVLEMLSHLNYNNLTILTNGLFTLMKATNYVPELNLICLGGVFRKPSFTFVGPDVEEYISKYHVDIAFVSAYGVTLEKGLMDPNPLDMEVKKFLCQNAKKIVVLIDSEKIGKSSLTPFLKLEDIHHLITDDGTSSEFIEELKKLNVEVDVVSI